MQEILLCTFFRFREWSPQVFLSKKESFWIVSSGSIFSGLSFYTDRKTEKKFYGEESGANKIDQESFSVSIFSTICGFAFPRLAFITCPTRY